MTHRDSRLSSRSFVEKLATRISWSALTLLAIACATADPVGASNSSSSSSSSSGSVDAGCAPSCPPLPPATALGSVILGTPSASGVGISVLSAAPLELLFEVGQVAGTYTTRTPMQRAEPNAPVTFSLTGLDSDATYHYRARFRTPGGDEFSAGDDLTFTTQRAPGKAFTFTMQADSHRDENSNLDLYKIALANVRADRPDFHIDLGDTFMTEKFAKTNQEVMDRYLAERSYFARIADTVPLLLVNGNHEGEQGWVLNGTADNLAVWATKARLTYFLNPLPDGFYTGDATSYPFVGKRGGYYAWTWGDALFVALDPFWFTTTKPGRGGGGDGWIWTLGEAQYRWLEGVLLGSKAKYKFVFSHHLVGGAASQRGGIEAADLWEWGGKNDLGVDEFATKRRGWARTIHQLFRDAKVSAWFHGHDHVYVKQDKDGVVYQEVPQPSHRGENGAQLASQAGYLAGTIKSSSGHLRVKVAGDQTTVEYVQAFLPADESPTQKNGQVADSYVVMPR